MLEKLYLFNLKFMWFFFNNYLILICFYFKNIHPTFYKYQIVGCFAYYFLAILQQTNLQHYPMHIFHTLVNIFNKFPLIEAPSNLFDTLKLQYPSLLHFSCCAFLQFSWPILLSMGSFTAHDWSDRFTYLGRRAHQSSYSSQCS